MSQDGILGQETAEFILRGTADDELYRLLASYGHGAEAIFKGFTKSAAALAAKPVRGRLSRALAREAEFAESVLRLPGAAWNSWAAALQVMDETWLRAHWRDLARASGDPNIFPALARDPREALARRGLRLLKRDIAHLTLKPGRMPSGIRALATIAGSDAEAALETEKPAPAPGSVSRAEAETLRKSLEKHRRRVREAEDERRRHVAEKDEEIRGLRRELRDARARNDALQAEGEDRLQRRLVEYRRRVLGLDAEHEGLARQVADPDFGGPTARAEEALRRQAAFNERHGVRSRIRAEIARLDELGEHLDAAIAESVTVLPETREARAAVSQRADALRTRLADPVETADTPDLASHLRALIKGAHLSAEGRKELLEVRAALDEPAVQGLLGEAATAGLRALLRDRLRLVDTHLESLRPQADGNGSAPRPAGPAEIWDVADALAARPPGSVILVVDGYNVVGRAMGVPADTPDRRELREARDRLTALCRRKAERFRNLELVYDGADTHAGREADGNFIVVFSRGDRDSQNADREILRRLPTLDRANAAVWLVTEDFGLRDAATPCCDAFLPPASLLRFLTG